MKLSLRRARKLEQNIGTKIDEGTDFTVNISVYDSNPTVNKLNDARARIAADVTLSVNLINLRAKLRRHIQEANETTGINSLISERTKMIGLLHNWRKVVSSHRTDHFTVEIVEGRLKALRERGGVPSTLYAQERDSVVVVAIGDDLLAEAKGHVTDLQRDIEKTDEEILALNTGSKITLLDDEVDLLRRVNLL